MPPKKPLSGKPLSNLTSDMDEAKSRGSAGRARPQATPEAQQPEWRKHRREDLEMALPSRTDDWQIEVNVVVATQPS
jgi:hypothetical protein